VRSRRPHEGTARQCRRLRREALDWLSEVRDEAWWTFDCSYPWVDLPLYIAAGIVSLGEVMAHANLSGDRRDRLSGCMRANSDRYGAGTLAERRRRAARGVCVATAATPGLTGGGEGTGEAST
jgi:hypothetical protein